MAESKYDEKDMEEVKVPFAKWEKPGRAYRGVYVQREIVPSNLPGEGGNTQQAIYYLADAEVRDDIKAKWQPVDGGIMKISGRGKRNPKVIPALENNLIKLGQVVMLEFTEEMQAKKPGMNAAKVIKVKTNRQMFHDVLAKYQSIDGDGMDLEEAAESLLN